MDKPDANPAKSQTKSPWLESLEGHQRKIAETMLESGLMKGEIEAELKRHKDEGQDE